MPRKKGSHTETPTTIDSRTLGFLKQMSDSIPPTYKSEPSATEIANHQQVSSNTAVKQSPTPVSTLSNSHGKLSKWKRRSPPLSSISLSSTPLSFGFFSKSEPPPSLSPSMEYPFPEPPLLISEKTSLLNIHKHIFFCLFGNLKIKQKHFAAFFSANPIIDEQIPVDDKHIFLQSLLLNLNSTTANMLLGHGTDKRQASAFAELLTYLTESMPQPQPGSIKSYIEAIADIKIEEQQVSVQFPYQYTFETEKRNYLIKKMYGYYDLFTFVLNTHTYETLADNVLDQIKTDLEELLNGKVLSPFSNGISFLDGVSTYVNRLLNEDKLIITHSHGISIIFNIMFVKLTNISPENRARHVDKLIDSLLKCASGWHIAFGINLEQITTLFNILDETQKATLPKKLFDLIDQVDEADGALTKKECVLFCELFIQSQLILSLELSLDNKLHLLRTLFTLKSDGIDELICQIPWLLKHIYQTDELKSVLLSRVKYWFSFDCLKNLSDETTRAFAVSDVLVDDTQDKTLEKYYYKYPLLTDNEITSINNIRAGITLSKIRQQWVITYKEILTIIGTGWEPSRDQLLNITSIKNKFYEKMVDHLKQSNTDLLNAHNPEHYTLESLPAVIGQAIQVQPDLVVNYNDQIKKMQKYYIEIGNHYRPAGEITVKKEEEQVEKTYPQAEGYISLSELVDQAIQIKIKNTSGISNSSIEPSAHHAAELIKISTIEGRELFTIKLIELIYQSQRLTYQLQQTENKLTLMPAVVRAVKSPNMIYISSNLQDKVIATLTGKHTVFKVFKKSSGHLSLMSKQAKWHIEVEDDDIVKKAIGKLIDVIASDNHYVVANAIVNTASPLPK